MLFNFSKKNKQESVLRENLGGFQDSFTLRQKKIILYSLFLIANSDHLFSDEEIQYFEHIAMILGFQINKTFIKECQSFTRTDINFTLTNLTPDQKDWYIVTVVDMVHVDGEAPEIKSKYATVIFNYMGISEERMDRIVKKAAAFTKYINSDRTDYVQYGEGINNFNHVHNIKSNFDHVNDVTINFNDIREDQYGELVHDAIYSTGHGSGLKHCLKFFIDGSVIFSINESNISSKADIDKINEWFNYEHPFRGRYKIDCNKIDFTITFNRDIWHYYGVILKDGLILIRTEENRKDLQFVFRLMDSRYKN
jgi:hypothetical protein